MKRLYRQLQDHWGEPDELVTFDRGSPDPAGPLDVVHVAIWHPSSDCDITSFNTLGMSETLMAGADYRAELNLGIRGESRLTTEAWNRLAGFLANIAAYPFIHDLKLDWWERLADPGVIPSFPGFTRILLAPSLDGEGLDRFDPPDDDVKILRTIPITAYENRMLKERGRNAFLACIEKEAVDLFLASRPHEPLDGV